MNIDTKKYGDLKPVAFDSNMIYAALRFVRKNTVDYEPIEGAQYADEGYSGIMADSPLLLASLIEQREENERLREALKVCADTYGCQSTSILAAKKALSLYAEQRKDEVKNENA